MVNENSETRAVAHFSCGATSAISTAIALKHFDEVEIIYADTNSEHSGNRDFLKSCEEKLFHQEITIVSSEKYNNIFDVFEARKFLASPAGAPCTTEMKKIPIREYLGDRLYSEVQVMGYDAGEKKRVDNFRKNNPEVNMWSPLYDKRITKANALALLQRFDLDLPGMYKLGYNNSNCIGCVKAENLSYWAAIREDFPQVFDWYAKFERSIGRKVDGVPVGAAINKRYIDGERQKVFLDELPKDIKPKRDISIECGYSCGMIADYIDDVVEDLPDDVIDEIQEMLL